MRIAASFVISVVLVSVAACSKQQAAPATTPASPAAPATPAATTPPPASQGPTISSAQEYEAVGLTLFERIAAAVAAAGTDCDKIAANLSKVIDDNQSEIGAMNAYEQQNPDADKTMSEEGRARAQKLAEPMFKSLGGCSGHAGVKAAIDRLENG